MILHRKRRYAGLRSRTALLPPHSPARSLDGLAAVADAQAEFADGKNSDRFRARLAELHWIGTKLPLPPSMLAVELIIQ